MSGWDTSGGEHPQAEGPAMILVEPQMGENIGAAARAMWNFGLDRMRLVDPRDGWPNPKAVAMSSGAAHVIENAKVTPTTAEAVEDLHYVYATTARPREMAKAVMTPEAAMKDAAARIARGEKVGVLFGRERTGLENDDVVRANAIVTVPVNPAFASLNLGQCVLLMSYEWRRQVDDTPAVQMSTGHSETAGSADVDRMLDHLEEQLEEAGFFHLPDKKPMMVRNLRNLFRRAPLTEQDVRTLWGVFRTLSEKRRRRG
ncbi:RNA methyltransferase [Rhodovulum sp. DZ06]|uniref:RNA methyltransferase n=1 Tax=Rhodovulum sp. DZ06 TaxID=3425126 RepID=UPI003D33A687